MYSRIRPYIKLAVFPLFMIMYYSKIDFLWKACTLIDISVTPAYVHGLLSSMAQTGASGYEKIWLDIYWHVENTESKVFCALGKFSTYCTLDLYPKGTIERHLIFTIALHRSRFSAFSSSFIKVCLHDCFGLPRLPLLWRFNTFPS